MTARTPLHVATSNGHTHPKILPTAALPRVRAGVSAQPVANSPLSEFNSNIESLAADAFAYGEACGERMGYIQGWRWGTVCGAFAGAMVGGILGALATALLRMPA